MRYKVKCLTIVVTVTLWLGNLWGCAAPGQEQNYKVSSPESAPIDSRQESRADAAGKPQEPGAPGAPDAAAPAVNGEVETQPSLKGLDRSHWPKIRAGATAGQSRHMPLYFKDCPIERNDPVVRYSDSPEVRMAAALANAEDRGWDQHSATVLLADTTKFYVDAALAPFRMIFEPPWQWQTAP